MTSCSGPIKYKDKVIGRILSCEARDDGLILHGEIDSGTHPAYSSDGEVYLRDEPDNPEGYRIAELMSWNWAGISVDFADGEPIGAEAFLTPATPA